MSHRAMNWIKMLMICWLMVGMLATTAGCEITIDFDDRNFISIFTNWIESPDYYRLGTDIYRVTYFF